MTELIDLHYQRNTGILEHSLSNQRSTLHQQTQYPSIYSLINKFLNNIDQINIKTSQNFIFQLDKTKILIQDIFYHYPIKIIGIISLVRGKFSLRIQFFDQKGVKVSAKSTHHRTVISNFVFEINAYLQNFKLQYSPVLGEFSLVFQVKANFIDKGMAIELMQFAMSSYIQECHPHFYVLHLIEFIDQNQNNYLRNIEEDFSFLKRWILERKHQNFIFVSGLGFYSKFLQLQQKEHQIQKPNPNQKRVCRQIKMIKSYLYPQSNKLDIEPQISAQKVRQVYKRFQKYFNDKQIIANYLTNRIKYQNLLTVDPIYGNKLQEFLDGKFRLKANQIYGCNILDKLTGRKIQNNQVKCSQNEQKSKEQRKLDCEQKSEPSQTDSEKISIGDKQSGKHYLVKMLHLNSSAKNQNFIIQKLCKFQSFLFINQYIKLQNCDVLQNQYMMVNAHPRRLILSSFLKKNRVVISFSSRIHICINLVEIVYTLHLKSKIQNYFPLISSGNLEISRRLSLSFHILSHISVLPLLELINTISMIIFETPLNFLKENSNIDTQLIKGDEVQNKNAGLSICIYFVKYYLYDLYRQVAGMFQVKQMRLGKKVPPTQIQDIEQWKKEKLSRTCQQLLVIFNHFKSIVSRGYEQKYSFEGQSDSEE